MNITDLFNPESSRPESGNNFISNLLESVVAELDFETVAVGNAIEMIKQDDAHRRDIGRSFGRVWDPLKNVGIVSHAVNGNTAEIVRDMAVNPIDGLRDKVDVKGNDIYLDKLIQSNTIADSSSDKEQAQKNVEAAFASADYMPVRIPEDFIEV